MFAIIDHMEYPNNDLWTVRQLDLLEGALEDMRGKTAIYYPSLNYRLSIPKIAEYAFKGIINFSNDDRLIMLEVGEGFGVTYPEIIDCLNRFDIQFIEQE